MKACPGLSSGNVNGKLDIRESTMDNAFPRQLFPHFYLDGPPEIKPKHSYGGWGSYERLFAVSPGLQSDGPHKFEPQRTVSGEEWTTLKPAVTPLMPPCKDAKVSSSDLLDPLNFPEQMQYFYQHHYMDAFPTMGQLLEENFTFQNCRQESVVSLDWAQGFLKGLNYKRCEYGNFSKRVRRYHHLLSDLVSDVPPSLLASLLHEELTTQSDRQQFCSDSTGGALGYFPFHESQDGGDGCLIYPSGKAMDKLFFHRVVQTFNDCKPPSFDMEPKPIAFDVNGAIKQLSLGNMEDVGHVAVRSDYFCGVWLLGDDTKPRMTDAIQTKDRFSCVTVSPHVPSEVVVANERGAAYLWTMKKGLQKFREEDSNLYFNAKSPWRWCEFSCHPRVMVYADRTGAELTDIRSSDCNHTLFRIGKTPACQTGERVILAKYLSDVHTHHHLINTQFSTYIMDERVPSVPMLKWEHMMEAPPMFACSLPAQTPSQTCKLLLGAHRSQELMLLQYTGGREHACQIQGPIQKLLSPKETLSHLNLQLPHQRRLAQKRLNVPATGLAALQNKNKNYISVFQLTETGDIFFQTLKLHTDQIPTDDLPEQNASEERTIENGESEKLQSSSNDDDQSSQSDSQTEGRSTALHQLEVIDYVHNGALNDLDTNKETGDEPSFQSKDPDLQVVWDEWFKPLFQKNEKRRPHFRRIRTSDLKGLKETNLNELDKDRLTRLRKDLQEVMKKKDLLLHSVTYLPHLNVTPVPDPVNPDEWPDDVSQRLAVSWDGHWKSWWEDKLGLTRGDKIANLRRKRRREKQARARSRTSLSGSFTSSVSYQESLSGWSSQGSQYLGSDDEPLKNSQASDGEEWRTRPEIHRKSPVLLRRFLNDQPEAEAAARSPQRRPDGGHVTSPVKPLSVRDERLTFATPSVAVDMDSGHRPVTLTSTQTPSSQLKKRKEFYLSSLPVSQTPTQNTEPDSGFSLSQMGFSTPTPSSSRVSQFRGSSQASQPKKKSRMGF